MTKDNFLYPIIDRSEEQRKLALNQSNTLLELSKRLENIFPQIRNEYLKKNMIQILQQKEKN